jgi:hypothetical protein
MAGRVGAGRWFARLGAVVVAAGALFAMDGAAMAATVQPFVSCYWQNPDGSITVAVGYTNSSASTVTYPIGALNYVTPAPQDRGQPTVFLAGTHDNVWAPTMSQADLGSGADWVVNGYHVSTGVGSLPACPTKPVPISGGAGGVVAFGAIAVLLGAAGYTRSKRLRARRSTPLVAPTS